MRRLTLAFVLALSAACGGGMQGPGDGALVEDLAAASEDLSLGDDLAQLDGSAPDLTVDPLAGLTSITVSPPSVMFDVDNVSPDKTQAFTATGHFSGGKPDVDVTAMVSWTVDNTGLGTISTAGLFTTSHNLGGTGTVTASAGGVMGTAALSVHFDRIVLDASAPADARTKLPPTAAGTVVGGSSPMVIYPSGGTMFPPNLFGSPFTFSPGTGNDLFRLEFKSAVETVSLYTTATTWKPTQAQWMDLAGPNAGDKTTLTIYAIAQASPGTVYKSTSMELGFAKKPIDGAIYYSSATTGGTVRSTVSTTGPQSYLGPIETGKCVACHTVSRNGARIAADLGGGVLAVYKTSDRSAVIAPAANILAAWTTFNPDNSRIVTAKGGVLTLRNGDTGAVISNLTLPTSGVAKYGTMPDWSPDGTKLVFAYSASNKDRGISGSSIATLDFAADAFTNFKVIVQSTGTADSRFYPTFSPDGKWVAYVATSLGTSDKNDLARLMIVPSDGSAASVELTKANTVVNNQTLSGTAAQLANTLPIWAPTQAGETMFLSFSSYRAFSTVYAKGSHNQIWITAIDPTLLPGSDPSAPAFRLPFQADTEDMFRAFWVPDGNTFPPSAGSPPACVPNLGGDCSAAPCCAPNTCSSTNGTTPYTCQTTIG